MVKPGTRERVMAAVDDLGYLPNRAARQLAGGRTGRLAVLVPDINNPWFTELIAEVEAAAVSHGHHALIAGTHHESSTELDAVRSVAGHVDGFICCSPVAAPTEIRRAARDLPVVYVNRRARGMSSVVVDQDEIVNLAAAHLRSLGHRRIALVLGPRAYWSTGRRERAAERAALATIGPFEPTFDGGRQAFEAVRAGGHTAVAAFNDVAAFGIVSAAIDAGVDVPAELSVVGSDNIAFAAMHRPALTTVDGEPRAVGAEAFAVLRRLVDAPDPVAERRTVAPALVVRRSTANAPAAAPAADRDAHNAVQHEETPT